MFPFCIQRFLSIACVLRFLVAGHLRKRTDKHDDDDDCMVMKAGKLVDDLHLSVSGLEFGDTPCMHILGVLVC